MENVIIRAATEEDAGEILGIYTPYITDTVITFEYTVPSLVDFKERMRKIISVYPFLVCLIDGRIAGYAYAGCHMERAAYQWNAVLSVYVKDKYTRCGVGSGLYDILIKILKIQRVENIYGVVTYPNRSSEKLHLKFGFVPVGIFRRTGFKGGRWNDVMWYEKYIGEENSEPGSLIAYPDLDDNLLKAILKNKGK